MESKEWFMNVYPTIGSDTHVAFSSCFPSTFENVLVVTLSHRSVRKLRGQSMSIVSTRSWVGSPLKATFCMESKNHSSKMDIIYITKFGYKCINYKIYSKKIQTIILATVQGGSAKLALGKDGTRRDIESQQPLQLAE